MLSSLGEKADESQTGLQMSRQEKPGTAQIDFSTFDSILVNARNTDKSEKTVDSLLQSMKVDTQVAAQVRDCRRIDELLDRLGVLLKTEVKPTTGISAFVGPAGGGKSTCLLQLITRQVISAGASSCGIINCDRYRSGAREQLDRFGSLLDIEVLHVNGNLNLNQAIARLAHRDFIAIDMPGLAISDHHLNAELFRLSSSNYDIYRYLVLPANLQSAVMNLVLDAYRIDDSMSCILTRLDECDSLGPAYSFLVRRNLPLSYMTEGPHIPGSMNPAYSVDVVQKMLSFACEPSVDQSGPEAGYADRQFAKDAMSDLTYKKRNTEVATNMAVDL